MSYKYKIGDHFKIKKNGKEYHGTIIKIASLDEFACDFHYSEKNYVVEFNNDTELVKNELIATYNIFRNGQYNYIMNENDIDLN